MSINIKSNERIFITGKTGSGKSYWIKKQLLHIERFVFYDPKHEHDDVDAVVVHTLDDLKIALAKHKRISYRPYLIDDQQFNELCRIIYNTGNLIFIIDEMAFHVQSWQIQPYHDLLQRLGRKRGIGIWNATQRPRCAHNTILSESDHIISFKLMLQTDRKKLAESFDPLFEKANELADYHWIYYNTREDSARVQMPV